MNIGFISTRLAGTDGVSLETAKLAQIVRGMGHQAFYCAGELDGDVPGVVDKRLHLADPVAVALAGRAFGSTEADPTLLEDIATRAEALERPVRQFLNDYQIDYLIVQNAFAIPIQLPLAQAIAGVLAETHADFRAVEGTHHERPKRLNASRPSSIN
jgi:hypothetical protein